MPAPRHSMEERVKQVLANHPEWGPQRVLSHLSEEARLLGESKGLSGSALANFLRAYDKQLPGPATITRIKNRFPVDKRETYLYQTAVVEWPKSFEQGLLPWESCGAHLELWRLIGYQPLLPLMRWFWRVTQTAPDAPIMIRYSIAATLAIGECIETAPDLNGPDAPVTSFYLASAPWRSKKHRELYEEKCPVWAQFNPDAPMQGKPSPPLEQRPYAADLVYGVRFVWSQGGRERTTPIDSTESLIREIIVNKGVLSPKLPYFDSLAASPNKILTREDFFSLDIYEIFDDWVWNEEWVQTEEGEWLHVSREGGPGIPGNGPRRVRDDRESASQE